MTKELGLISLPVCPQIIKEKGLYHLNIKAGKWKKEKSLKWLSRSANRPEVARRSTTVHSIIVQLMGLWATSQDGWCRGIELAGKWISWWKVIGTNQLGLITIYLDVMVRAVIPCSFPLCTLHQEEVPTLLFAFVFSFAGLLPFHLSVSLFNSSSIECSQVPFWKNGVCFLFSLTNFKDPLFLTNALNWWLFLQEGAPNLNSDWLE